jgi:hypothetical protein
MPTPSLRRGRDEVNDLDPPTHRPANVVHQERDGEVAAPESNVFSMSS